MKNKSTHASLIIGNGFDIDLGLPTRYSDFAKENNPEWKDYITFRALPYTKILSEERIDNSLLAHLYNARKNDKWFNIEEVVHEYVVKNIKPDDIQIGSVREQYENLRENLKKYLIRIIRERKVKSDSLAMNLLKRLTNSNCIFDITSFNYTDCLDLCDCKKTGNPPFHIHGSLKGEDIILGCRAVGDEKENQNFDFLYKTHNTTASILYDTANILNETEVIIFGHSLNEIDACYFKALFESERRTNQERHLTIICWDENDEKMITSNIRKWTIDESIISNWNIKYVHTKGWYMHNDHDINTYLVLCNRLKI